MKGSKFFSALFGILGILLMVVTAAVSIASRNAQPRMLESPEAASAQAQRMMDALCAGDYEAAQSCIYGQPDLGAGEPEDAVSKLLWDAFTDSLSYEFTGLCRVTDTGFARDATVTCLDVSGVTAAVPQRAKALLPILVPLFISAFRRADELAIAMESRCYHGGEGRTRMKQLKYEGRDWAGLILGLAMVAVMIALRVMGL